MELMRVSTKTPPGVALWWAGGAAADAALVWTVSGSYATSRRDIFTITGQGDQEA
jgi:hypothetical protein